MSNHSDTPQDGLAYTIHLLDGTKISHAVYHHCAASSQHYYAKGDQVFPVEEVFRHSMHGIEIPEDMPPQVLTDTYCGHRIEVTFTSVVPYCTLTQIPDDVLDCLMEDLKDNVTSGTFSHEQTGDTIHPDNGDKSIYATFEGSWRVVQLPYDIMYRIVRWWWTVYDRPTVFDRAMFDRYFGPEAGGLYHDSWVNVWKGDLLDMFGCFINDPQAGQTFCNMIMQQVEQFEKEVKDEKE